ncbi:SH3 domain-containing protein [Flavobacterium oreochromis]|uniref:SH3 domain-containing protein n=1 Tax=Flavobacterium oreochromis TaxID=2906078 RepID=UPI0013F5EF51
MKEFDLHSSLKKINESIENSIKPLKSIDWIDKTTYANKHFLDTINSIKRMENNFFIPSSLDKLPYNNWANESSIKLLIESINKTHKINISDEILNKIKSESYWNEMFKISIVNNLQSSIIHEQSKNEVPNELILEVSNNLDVINSNLDEINRDTLRFFNEICLSIKKIIDENPSIKYSAQFIFWLIGVIIIPTILNQIQNSSEKSTTEININNNFSINNTYTNIKIGIINVKEVNIKNFPRDKSRTTFIFKKNEQVQILRDSLKWALVIKNNSIESGWIRKEYLNFMEN